MYFGSVRFFKHLIMLVIALLIIIPIIIAAALGIENARKEERLTKLEDEVKNLNNLMDVYKGKTDYTAEDLCGIISAADVPYSEVVKLIYDKQPDAFSDLLSDSEKENIALPELDNTIDVTTSSASASVPVNDIPAIAHDSNIPYGEKDAPDEDAEDIPNIGENDTPIVSETENNNEEEPLPEYTELYPDLYVDLPPVTSYNEDDNHIYLTFDDGPSDYTNDLLNYLDKYNIKATFFVIPKNTEQSFARMKKIVEKGHTIGVHSLTHDYEKIYSGVEEFLEDFNSAYQLVYEATGVKCELFRFPGGSKNDYNEEMRDEIIEEMKRRGFIYFDWNVDSEDALGATWEQMYNNVLSETALNNRSIILMHDGYERTVLVLEDIIKALQDPSKNYTFSALSREVRPMQF